MKRREYLAAVTTGTVAGTAGCFWEDGNSKARLGLVSVSNVYEQPQRFVVHVEENGEDVLTTEIALDAVDSSSNMLQPAYTTLDCEWSTNAGEFTVEIFQFTEPTDSAKVSLPGEPRVDDGNGDCVGVGFRAGSSNSDHIVPRVYSCESYLDTVDFCLDEP